MTPLSLRFQYIHGDNFLLHCTVLIELSYDTHPRVYCITSKILSLKPSWKTDIAGTNLTEIGCIIWLVIERSI